MNVRLCVSVSSEQLVFYSFFWLVPLFRKYVQFWKLSLCDVIKKQKKTILATPSTGKCSFHSLVKGTLKFYRYSSTELAGGYKQGANDALSWR